MGFGELFKNYVPLGFEYFFLHYLYVKSPVKLMYEKFIFEIVPEFESQVYRHVSFAVISFFLEN